MPNRVGEQSHQMIQHPGTTQSWILLRMAVEGPHDQPDILDLLGCLLVGLQEQDMVAIVEDRPPLIPVLETKK